MIQRLIRRAGALVLALLTLWTVAVISMNIYLHIRFHSYVKI